jgi:hypothetical protein
MVKMKKNITTNNRMVLKTRPMSTYNYMAALCLLIIQFSCTTAKLSVPEKFSTQATRMPVKGINGWQVGQRLSFGTYATSTIKRGWDFSSSLQYTKFRIRPEEAVLKVFDISTDNNINKQRSKFQYSISDGNNLAEVYATEKFSEKQLVYKSNNPWIGNASKTKKYDYAFTAAIVPVERNAEPWSLVLVNSYDINKDTAHGIFDKPYVEEEGYATNGNDNIAIRPLRIEKLTTKGGRQTRVFGGKMLSGYELQWDGGVVAIIDILDNNIWVYNDLDPKEKIILSAVSSAILLKRMQDVEKDRDSYDK